MSTKGTDRVTRGQEKRKPTLKYELFKESTAATKPISSVFEDKSEQSDAYILKLAKQQSSVAMSTRAKHNTMNSTPDKGVTNTLEESGILEHQMKNRFMKSK